MSATWQAAALIASEAVCSGSAGAFEHREVERVVHEPGRRCGPSSSPIRSDICPAAVSAEDNGLGALIDRGGDVGGFGADEHRHGDHRFEHLRGDDHGLSGQAAGMDHLRLIVGTSSGGISTRRSPRATINGLGQFDNLA